MILLSIRFRSFSLFFRALCSLSSFILLRCHSLSLKFMLLSLGNLNKLSLRMSNIVLPRPVDIVLRVSKELNPMGNPSSNTGNSE